MTVPLMQWVGLMQHLEINKVEAPHRQAGVGVVPDQQGVLEVVNRLAAEGILCRGVDSAAAGVGGAHSSYLQLHRVQTEPVACGHGIEPLTHGKAAAQQKTGISDERKEKS